VNGPAGYHAAKTRAEPGVSVPVDVLVETVIDRPVAEVAAFTGDPSNAPAWYVNIKRVEWKTKPPVRVGSQMEFMARFLGKTLVYTYEVVELQPGRKLVMRTAQGPFPMETTYTWESAGPGQTRMTLRNRGEPTGFAKVATPLMVGAMKRATTKDLAKLKGLLESRGEP
jgi:hypothetical protein